MAHLMLAVDQDCMREGRQRWRRIEDSEGRRRVFRVVWRLSLSAVSGSRQLMLKCRRADNLCQLSTDSTGEEKRRREGRTEHSTWRIESKSRESTTWQAGEQDLAFIREDDTRHDNSITNAAAARPRAAPALQPPTACDEQRDTELLVIVSSCARSPVRVRPRPLLACRPTASTMSRESGKDRVAGWRTPRARSPLPLPPRPLRLAPFPFVLGSEAVGYRAPFHFAFRIDVHLHSIYVKVHFVYVALNGVLGVYGGVEYRMPVDLAPVHGCVHGCVESTDDKEDRPNGGPR
ncbi:hypothetical protein C8R45DRAFT_1078193 [Mycena sanguinolenta]|nr:hypothetical protein C8R45DRAFT_1078193 [Mycena sanguinolenta]